MKKNGTIANYYRWNYGEDSKLPTNVCPLFWKMLISLLLLPITIWTVFPQNLFFNTNKEWWTFGRRIGYGILTLMIFMFIALWVYQLIFNTTEAITVLGVGICVALTPVVIIGAGHLIFNFFDKKKESEVFELIKLQKESFMNKYCMKINWEDDND